MGGMRLLAVADGQRRLGPLKRLLLEAGRSRVCISDFFDSVLTFWFTYAHRLCDAASHAALVALTHEGLTLAASLKIEQAVAEVLTRVLVSCIGADQITILQVSSVLEALTLFSDFDLRVLWQVSSNAAVWKLLRTLSDSLSRSSELTPWELTECLASLDRVLSHLIHHFPKEDSCEIESWKSNLSYKLNTLIETGVVIDVFVYDQVARILLHLQAGDIPIKDVSVPPRVVCMATVLWIGKKLKSPDEAFHDFIENCLEDPDCEEQLLLYIESSCKSWRSDTVVKAAVRGYMLAKTNKSRQAIILGTLRHVNESAPLHGLVLSVAKDLLKEKCRNKSASNSLMEIVAECGYLNLVLNSITDKNRPASCRVDDYDGLFILLLALSTVPESDSTLIKGTSLALHVGRFFRYRLAPLHLKFLAAVASQAGEVLGSLLQEYFMKDTSCFLPDFMLGCATAKNILGHSTTIISNVLPLIFSQVRFPDSSLDVPEMASVLVDSYVRKSPAVQLDIKVTISPDGSCRTMTSARIATDDHNELNIWIQIIRLCMRAGVSFVVIPRVGDPQRLTGAKDWSLKSNVKKGRRERLLVLHQKTLKEIEALFVDSEDVYGLGGLIFLLEDSQSEVTMLAVDFDHLRTWQTSNKPEMSFSAAEILMTERPLILPNRSLTECEIIIDYMKMGLENFVEKSDRARFIRQMKLYFERWMDSVTRLLPCTGDSADSLSPGVKEVLVPFCKKMLQCLMHYLTPSTSYPYLITAIELLRIFTDGLSTQGIERLTKFVRSENLRLAYSLRACLNTNWEDVRDTAVHILGRMFRMDDLLLADSDLDSALMWMESFLASPKSRDYEVGTSWFTLVNAHIVGGTLDEHQWKIVKKHFAIEGSGPMDVVHYLSSLVRWQSKFIDGFSLPCVHGSLKCLGIAIRSVYEKRREEACIHEDSLRGLLLDDLYDKVLAPCTNQLLKFIALGEDKVLLEETVMKTRSDDQALPNIRLDCRGHLILVDQEFKQEPNDECLRGGDRELETTLIHPSSFSRYWLSVKSCGEVLAIVIANVHLHPEFLEQMSRIEFLIQEAILTLLASRHPALLEGWASVVSAGIQRCARLCADGISANQPSAIKWGSVPIKLISRVLNSITELANIDEDDCFKLPSQSKFSVVPPPLRKSISLCTVLGALVDSKLLTKPKDFALSDASGQPLSHSEFAYAIVHRLLETAKMDSGEANEEDSEALISAKFHSLNLLRSLITQKSCFVPAFIHCWNEHQPSVNWTSVRKSSNFGYDAIDNMDSFYGELLLIALDSLHGTCQDFRIKNASNLLFVSVQDLMTNARKITGDCNLGSMETIAASHEAFVQDEFYSPNPDCYVRRCFNVLAKNVDAILKEYPPLFYRLISSLEDQTSSASNQDPLLLFFSMLRPWKTRADEAQRIISLVSAGTLPRLKSTVEIQQHQENNAGHSLPEDWKDRLLSCVVHQLNHANFFSRTQASGVVLSLLHQFVSENARSSISCIQALLKEDHGEGSPYKSHSNLLILRGIMRSIYLCRNRFESTFHEVTGDFEDAGELLIRLITHLELESNVLLLTEALLLVEEFLMLEIVVPALQGICKPIRDWNFRKSFLQPSVFLQVIYSARIGVLAILSDQTFTLSERLNKCLICICALSDQVQEQAMVTLRKWLLHGLPGNMIASSAGGLSGPYHSLCKQVKHTPRNRLAMSFVQLTQTLLNQIPNSIEDQDVKSTLQTLALQFPSFVDMQLAVANCMLTLSLSIEWATNLCRCCMPSVDIRTRAIAATHFIQLWKSNAAFRLVPAVQEVLPFLFTDECTGSIRRAVQTATCGQDTSMRSVSQCTEWLCSHVMATDDNLLNLWRILLSTKGGLTSLSLNFAAALHHKCGMSMSENSETLFAPDSFFDDEFENIFNADVEVLKTIFPHVMKIDAQRRKSSGVGQNMDEEVAGLEKFLRQPVQTDWNGQRRKASEALYYKLASLENDSMQPLVAAIILKARSLGMDDSVENFRWVVPR